MSKEKNKQRNITVLVILILLAVAMATSKADILPQGSFTISLSAGESVSVVQNTFNVTWTAVMDWNATDGTLTSTDNEGEMSFTNTFYTRVYVYFDGCKVSATKNGNNVAVINATLLTFQTSDEWVFTFTAVTSSVLIVTSGESVYFRNTIVSVNNQTGYELATLNTLITQTVTESFTSGATRVGFRIWLVGSNGYQTELTSGTPIAVMSRTINGNGTQEATYDMATHNIAIGSQCFKVNVYFEVDGGWTAAATFLSQPIMSTRLEANTWVFSMWTSRDSGAGEASFKFGSASYPATISGLILSEPDLWAMAMYYFHTGNYIMFFLYPYTRLIGMSPFVSIVIFGIGLTVYIRFRNLYFLLLVIVALLMGGVLQFIMGDALMGFVALLCAFALGALYWKVFR